MEQLIDTVLLAGDRFGVDLRRGGLVSEATGEQLLPFQKMEPLVTGSGIATHRRILYDTEAKDFYVIEPTRVILPPTVKLLEIPHEQFIGGTNRQVPDIVKLDFVDFTSAGIYGAREIPRQKIFGTEFFVDTMKLELRQVNNPKNRISFEDFSMNQHQIYFDYHLQYKNVPKPEDIYSPHTTTAWLPLFSDMDAVVWQRIQRSQVEIDQMLNNTAPAATHKPRKMDPDPGKQQRTGASR